MSAFEDFSSSGSEFRDLLSRFESGSEGFYDIDEYEDLAAYYLQHAQLDMVHQVLKLALHCFPDAPELRIKKAQYLAALQNTQEALVILNQLEDLIEFKYDVYMIRGHIYSQIACSEQAIEQFKLAIPHADEPEDVYTALGIEFLNAHKPSDALYYLKKALKENPALDALYPDVFLCFEYTVQLKEAVNFFHAATDHSPFNFQAWFYLGISYLKLPDPPQAIKAFEYALAIQDQSVVARINKAQAHYQLEQYLLAIEVLNEALVIDDQDAQVYFSLAEAYQAIEDYNQALVFYNKCIKCDPAWADAWMGIAMVLDHLNRITEALHYIRKAVEINPQESEYWYVLAEFQQKMGFYEESEQAFQRVIECDYAESDVWMDYGCLLIQMDLYDKALDIFLQGIKQFPKFIELYYLAAAALLKLHQRQSALELLEQALQMDITKCELLFETIPALSLDLEILDLINSYKSKDSWV